MLALALRRLRRAPAFAIPAILTLTLGVAAVTAMFAIVDHVLLRPLPFPRSAELVDVGHTLVVGNVMNVDMSDATYLLYRRDNRVFTDIGAYSLAAANLTGVEDAAGGMPAAPAQRVTAVASTASLFHVLGVQPIAGRLFDSTDDTPGAAPVALLGESEWERLFQRDAHVEGRRIVVDGIARTVVGVLPRESDFPANGTDVWIPLALDPARTRSAAFDYHAVARLAPHVSADVAARELTTLLPRVPVVFPGRLTAAGIALTHMRVTVRPLRDVVVGDARASLWALFAAMAVLLLVVSGNVGNLFLARVELRRREVAVRRALGASRRALASDWAWESVVIVASGAALGIFGAWLALRALGAFAAASAIPRLAEVRIDWPVMLVAVAAGALVALVAGVAAVARADAARFTELLGASNRSMGDVAGHRVRRALVIAQVALALLLVSTAALFARSFARLHAVQPGFDAAGAYVFHTSLPAPAYPTTSTTAAFATRALGDLRAIPGVSDAGVSSRAPFDVLPEQDSAVFVEDRPLRPGQLPGIHEIVFASPGYFAALRIPLLAGRGFEAIDPAGMPDRGTPPAVVSAAFARRYWHTVDVVGKRVRANPAGPWLVISGVVGDVRDTRIERDPEPIVYLPFVTTSASGAPWTPRDLAFVIRTTGDPTRLAMSIDRVMRNVDPSVPVYAAGAMSQRVDAAMARTTFALTLLSVAALIALAIGALGMYGVLAYIVSARTREIGVRLALGATPARVRRGTTMGALGDAAIGVAVGTVAAVGLTRLVAGLLFEVSATDPLAIGGAAALLLAIAIAATWVPARRASRLDPAMALRAD